MSTQTDRSKICAVTGCGGAMAMHPEHKCMFPTCAKCKGSWTLDEADRGIGADPPQQASKADAGKARLDLIPRDALEALAAALAFGAAKYAPWDWTKGRAWSRDYAAVQRHLSAWFEGEDNDPIDGPNGSKGSGLSHLAHALCGVAFLIVFQRRGIGTDDRFKWPLSVPVDAPAAEPEPTAAPAPAADWILVDKDRPSFFYRQTPNGWVWVKDRGLATGFPSERTAHTAAPTTIPFLAELREPEPERPRRDPAEDWIVVNFTGRSYFRATADSFEWTIDRNQATGFDSSYAAGRALDIRNLSMAHTTERRGPRNFGLAPGHPLLG